MSEGVRIKDEPRRMKDSGVGWIGAIPEEWEVDPLGKSFIERKGKVSDLDFEPLSVTKNGIVKQLDNAAKTKNHSDRKKVCKGDFVINSRSDRKQSCGLSTLDGSVSVINIVLDGSTIYPGFTRYLLDNYGFAEEFYRWGTGIVDDLWSTRFDKMKRILLPHPPSGEQQAIANYLDSKVTLIDDIIEKTKQSIEDYKKYKQSLITETVTKGLNPDVEMKDSGIEWIGKVPRHWKTVILNRLYSQIKERNKDLVEDNLLSLSYGRIVQRDISSNEGLLPENFEGYNIIGNGNIVLRLTDLQNDHTSLRVGLCTQTGIITSAYISLKGKGNHVDKYMYYHLHSFDIYKGFYGMGSGVRQSLTFDGIKGLKLLSPPLHEQQQIADYLDDKCSQIDNIISQKETLIKELKTYKKSLIYECVTGKVYVG